MNYKKLIKSRDIRIKILQFLSFIPDKWMLRIQYMIKTGRSLNLSNPKRYTEKLQWYKLYYRDPLMAQCADKYDVRKYVEQVGLAKYLNTVYGVYNSTKEIEFETLPRSFVLKDTLGGGGNSVILVKDKNSISWTEICAQMEKWVNQPDNAKTPGREWVYEGRKHRIIIEELLESDETGDLPDYKFFCFHGKPEFLYMMSDYTQHHSKGRLGFLTTDFKLLPVQRADFLPMQEQPEKPLNYTEMLDAAKVLSAPFPHVRVDMYNINGKIIFGELTFFNASGYVQFTPDTFDYTMGEKFHINRLK